MSLLALDVGFKSTGYAVIEKGAVVVCGTIITEKSTKKTTRTADDYYARSSRLAMELECIIDKYEVKGIVGELPTGGAQSAKAAVMMGMATAVVAAVASLKNVPCEWCTPTEVKLAVSGCRSASKDEMMDNVRGIFAGKGDDKFPKAKAYFEHIADALGAYMALKGGNLVRIYG